MGISSFPGAADGGVLPVLVMNTVLSVALLKNLLRSLLQIMGANWSQQDFEQDPVGISHETARERRISITKFKSLNCSGGGCCGGGGGGGGFPVECCVCLSGFEEEEEVSELDCKHFFHRRCLEKWFDNKHSTCPLCRSIIV